MGLVTELSDRIDEMKKTPRKVAVATLVNTRSGPPAEVYRTPTSEFVAGFLGRSNLLRGRVAARADGLATIETEGGLTVCAVGVEAAAGERVVLLLRPELVEIGPPGRTGANCFEGVVSQVAYMGSFVEYVVDAAGQPLLVQAPAGAHQPQWMRGDKVTVGWEPDRAAPIRAREGIA